MRYRISVVLPVLNEALHIEDTLLRLRDFGEVVVADGESDDETVAVARRCGGTVIASPRGRARQMNAGASAASGDILVFLHADTRLPDGAAARIGAAAGRPGFVWGRFDVRIVGQSRLLPLVSALMNLRSRMSGIATGDQAMFMTRRAFDEVGGFPNLPIMEDIALSASLRRLGRPVCIRAPAMTSGRRWDTNGALRTILTMWIMRLGFWMGVSPDRLARLYATLGRG